MRLGIFGGTFDPIHFGHLLLAETCRESCALDSVLFLPTAVPPHKQRELTAADRRVEMIELAIGGHEAFGLCRYEVDRGGINYTAETLAALHSDDPTRELFFLLGSDSLADLPNWRDPARVCELATLVVVVRSGQEDVAWNGLAPFASEERLARFRDHQVEMPRIDLSSRELRARVVGGKSIRYRVPRSVEKYIEVHELYRGEPAE